mgnify:CR=1 FL=1
MKRIDNPNKIDARLGQKAEGTGLKRIALAAEDNAIAHAHDDARGPTGARSSWAVDGLRRSLMGLGGTS